MGTHAELVIRLREFAAARNWDQFHSPKNLTMALAGEVGELVAELQWLSDSEIEAGLQTESPLRDAVENEMADVLIYLARLADIAGVDLYRAAEAKVERNERRYPVAQSYGSAVKYTRLPANGNP
jgi:dCTP diphosphatase